LNVNGMSAALGGIPENWVSKTMDVCNYVSLLSAFCKRRMHQDPEPS
jgi:hypothetical protein